MQDVFIIGSRGLPAKYGGFETFVEELIKNRQSSQVTYHVACLSDSQHQTHFDYLGVDCFTINPPKLGPARVIAYDMMAIGYALSLIREHKISNPIIYILGNTIGPFMPPFARQIHKLGGRVFVNPDGLEWKRSKWARPVRAYLKQAEKAMTKVADLIIADNKGIESYLTEVYPWSKTTCIAYGTDMKPSSLRADSPQVRDFFDKWQCQEKTYYLIVGRFVPENNYQTIIREFMKSTSQRDLLIVCNHEGNAYWDKLAQVTGFKEDKRIKFVGTVYDRELLTYLRQEAFAYLHGHEVGGTNPSLLEALAHTEMNLILDVTFNREVAVDSVCYWTKESGHLADLINQIDGQTDFSSYGQRAKQRIKDNYTWSKIVGEYEDLFLDES